MKRVFRRTARRSPGGVAGVAVNAWMADRIHGEDGREGYEGSRGPTGHDWQARMRTLTQMPPDITSGWSPWLLVSRHAGQVSPASGSVGFQTVGSTTSTPSRRAKGSSWSTAVSNRSAK